MKKLKKNKIVKQLLELRVGNIVKVYYLDAGSEIREIIGVIIGIYKKEKLTNFVFRCEIFGIKFDRRFFIYAPSFFGWEKIGNKGFYKKSKLLNIIK